MFFSVRISECNQEDSVSCEVSRLDAIEPAVELALILHRYSNCPHVVTVVRCSDLIPPKDVECLTLILHPESDGK